MAWLTKPPLGTQLDWANPLNTGLAGFWIFNEGSGDKVNDLSGNNNNGTLTNISLPSTSTSGWNTGRLGPSIAFDGIDDFINIGNVLDLGSTFTISIWSKYYTTGNPDRTLLSKMPNTIIWWDLQVRSSVATSNAGKYNFQFDDDVTKAVLLSTNRIDDSQWHHAVVTRDATGYKLYVDTILNSSFGNNGNISNSGSIQIGSNTYQGLYFNGMIDEVRIWNRALSSTERSTLYTDPYNMFLDTGCPPVICTLNIT